MRSRYLRFPIAVAVGAAVLAGCSQPADDGGPQTLTVWYPQEQWQKSAEYFEQNVEALQATHPDATVDFVLIPYAEYEARYQAALSGGGDDAPDIFVGPVPYYVHLGVAAQAPPDLQEQWSATVVESIAAAFQVDGSWYGYPDSADLGMELYYNTAMFEEAGLDPDAPPSTFQELAEYADQLAVVEDGQLTRNGFSVRYDGSPTGIADKALPFIHAFGGRLYAEDQSTSDGYLNGPGAVAGLTFLQELVQGPDAVASLTLGNPDNTFAQGLSAMTFREAWYAGYLDENAPDVEYAVAPYPTGPQGYPQVSLLFNWAYIVNAKGEQQELAWDWLRTFDAETDLAVAELEGYLPVLQDNYDDPYVADRVDYEAVQMQLAEGSGPQYTAPLSVQINTRIGEAVEQILQGADVQSTLDDAVADVDDLLAQGS